MELFIAMNSSLFNFILFSLNQRQHRLKQANVGGSWYWNLDLLCMLLKI